MMPTIRSTALVLAALLNIEGGAIGVLAVGVASAAPAMSAAAAGQDPLPPEGVDAIGSGVQLMRVPVGFWLRDPEEKGWGFRLQIPIAFGVNEFTLLDEVTLGSLHTLSIVPRVEFWVPVGKLITLRPWVGIGWGKDFTSGNWALLGDIGSKFDVEPAAGDWSFLIRPEITLDLVRGRNNDYDEDVLGLLLKGDVLHPLWFDIGSYRPDVSVYGQVRQYLDGLELPIAGGDSLVIDRQYELGITFGTEPQLSLGFIRLSRLHVAYRWGEGLHGIRILLGPR